MTGSTFSNSTMEDLGLAIFDFTWRRRKGNFYNNVRFAEGLTLAITTCLFAKRDLRCGMDGMYHGSLFLNRDFFTKGEL